MKEQESWSRCTYYTLVVAAQHMLKVDCHLIFPVNLWKLKQYDPFCKSSLILNEDSYLCVDSIYFIWAVEIVWLVSPVHMLNCL